MSFTTFAKQRPLPAGAPAAWRGQLSRVGWLAALCSALLGGCLVDLSDRCGNHQTYDDENTRCVCAAGYGLDGTDCVACGENEVGSLDGCACAPGYLRATPDAPCAAQDTLGHDCKTDEDCVNPEYNHCQRETADGGYCTSAGCTSSADCPNSIDYACNTRESPSFCERPPTGFGMQCGTDADCAGFEASYCENASSNACLVNDCKADPDICYGDQVCCDIALIGASICVPPGELEDGACPAAGTLIKAGS